MGSLFHLPVVEGDLPQLLPQLMPDRAQIIAASPYGEESCYDVDFTRPTWLVVGSEGSGISPAVGALARNVRIPMPGRAESLNVAMAATVLLFEAVRQRCFSQK
jgi:TrmH family RNA methyltransferase